VGAAIAPAAQNGHFDSCHTIHVSSPVCTAPGVLRTIIDGEIAAGLARLRVSRKELLAEADLYPWVGEYPEVYEPLPLGVMFRARAVADGLPRARRLVLPHPRPRRAYRRIA
jgi:hypothetical protein